MAQCEVCGMEQFPANTIIEVDADDKRHFFCSWAHRDAWMVGKPSVIVGPAPVSAENVVEMTASEAGTVLEEHKAGGEVSEEAASEAARVLADAPDRVPKRRSTRKTVQRRSKRPS